MRHAFLPFEGSFWLCRVNRSEVVPLAIAPGGSDAKRRFSNDGCEFGVLDQGRKRLAHYRVLEQAPWFETIRSPANLPKGCVAHALLVHKGVMLAGGHADHGEALWIRQAGRQPDWVSVTLPEGLGRRGKAIDALYVRGQVLVAIDNILRPKWVLVYPLDPELDATGVQKFSLASHTTYETIQRAAEGPDVYVLQSHGYNHGITSIYLSVIRKDDFAEIGGWSGVSEPTTQQLVDEVYWGITLGEDLFVGEPRELDLVTGTLMAWSKRQAKSRCYVWRCLGSAGPERPSFI